MKKDDLALRRMILEAMRKRKDVKSVRAWQNVVYVLLKNGETHTVTMERMSDWRKKHA